MVLLLIVLVFNAAAIYLRNRFERVRAGEGLASLEAMSLALGEVLSQGVVPDVVLVDGRDVFQLPAGAPPLKVRAFVKGDQHSLAIAAALGCASGSAFADGDRVAELEDRIAELEAMVQQLMNQQRQAPPPPDTAKIEAQAEAIAEERVTELLASHEPAEAEKVTPTGAGGVVIVEAPGPTGIRVSPRYPAIVEFCE